VVPMAAVGGVFADAVEDFADGGRLEIHRRAMLPDGRRDAKSLSDIPGLEFWGAGSMLLIFAETP
jgi:hypothetical protein